jgi:protein O-GlcNAc transferase
MHARPASAALAAQSFNAANADHRAGRWQEALSGFEAALGLDANLAPAQLGRARCLVQLGQWMPAREAFAACLRLEPGHFSAWLEAGHLCRQMGELQQAAGAYQRAIDAAPERFEAHLAMARVLPLLGQAALGDQAFEEAMQRLARSAPAGERPAKLADAAQRMGQYRLEQGDAGGAVRALQRGLQALEVGDTESASVLCEALSASMYIDLGEALWRLGQREPAMAALTAASAATDEPALARLGALSFRLNLWQEALAVLRRNVELHPNSPNAHWNLAHVLADCWQMQEAERVLQQAQALAPMPGAQSLRASMAGRRGDADAALAIYRELAAAPGGQQYASSAAMSSLYSDRLTAQEVAQLHRLLFAPLGVGARARESFVREPLAGRRLRLGLVTADFHHQHPVNIFMQPVLREIDRSRFEVFVYFTGVSYDDQTRLAQRRAQRWVEVSTLNDAQLAKRIDADRIDVLLDLAGHTGQQRMSLFARRAAPVQATYLGYPGSTGVPNMDWVIGDEVVTPQADDALCSERVARLPGVVFCFAPETDHPEPDWSDPKFLQRPLTLGSFNNVPKLTPRTLALWARVLAAVPDARLVLKAPSFGDASAVAAFSERWTALGVDLGRVEFRGPVGLDLMMAEYADIDIALDPVPYNGGTTSLQAMWMGVPVLTLRGAHFVSRMGASFMSAAGLPEWVAADEAAYVAMVASMAQDRQALLALKRGLRQRLQAHPGWDPVAHTRNLEQAWLRMAADPDSTPNL